LFVKCASILYINHRLPLRAGRGVPIAQGPGPAEERKARGRGLMPRFPRKTKFSEWQSGIFDSMMFCRTRVRDKKVATVDRKDDKGAILCEADQSIATGRMFRTRSSLNGEELTNKGCCACRLYLVI
jgi:hypothetical protein